MNTTIGTSQQTISAAGGTTASSQTIYVTRFVSPPIFQTSIAANTWTLSVAFAEDVSQQNFPVNGTSQSLLVNCYVWRPTTSSKVGTIRDGSTAATIDEATSERASTTTFTGSSVGSMTSGTDVIIVEIWSGPTAVTRTTSSVMYFYYNGTTVTTTDGAVSSHASFLETPENLALTVTDIDMTQVAAKTYSNKFITKV